MVDEENGKRKRKLSSASSVCVCGWVCGGWIGGWANGASLALPNNHTDQFFSEIVLNWFTLI